MIIKEGNIMWSLQKHEAIEYLELLIAAENPEDICIQDQGIGEFIPDPIVEFDYYSSKEKLARCLEVIKIYDSIEEVQITQYDHHLSLTYNYSYSICELTDSTDMLKIIAKDFKKELKDCKQIYMLNRIKTAHHRQGKGDGTKLMLSLAALADKQGFHIISSVNAYGDLSHDDLVKWYKKHGFKYYHEKNTILRSPMV